MPASFNFIRNIIYVRYGPAAGFKSAAPQTDIRRPPTAIPIGCPQWWIGSHIGAFGELVPRMAQKFNIDAATMLLPMQETASPARTVSPITAVIIAASGMAKIKWFDLARRTSVPIAGGTITAVVRIRMLFFSAG
jgi:hypothetical protein